jgi:opacity protein-like surface antigen
MRKSAFLVAALLAALSTGAVAKDVKQPKHPSPVQMSDSDMDKVTAGNNGANGGGVGFGGGNGNDRGQGPTHNNFHARFQ